jgi:hypothetical protein
MPKQAFEATCESDEGDNIETNPKQSEGCIPMIHIGEALPKRFPLKYT